MIVIFLHTWFIVLQGLNLSFYLLKIIAAGSIQIKSNFRSPFLCFCAKKLINGTYFTNYTTPDPAFGKKRGLDEKIFSWDPRSIFLNCSLLSACEFHCSSSLFFRPYVSIWKNNESGIHFEKKMGILILFLTWNVSILKKWRFRIHFYYKRGFKNVIFLSCT